MHKAWSQPSSIQPPWPRTCHREIKLASCCAGVSSRSFNTGLVASVLVGAAASAFTAGTKPNNVRHVVAAVCRRFMMFRSWGCGLGEIRRAASLRVSIPFRRAVPRNLLASVGVRARAECFVRAKVDQLLAEGNDHNRSLNWSPSCSSCSSCALRPATACVPPNSTAALVCRSIRLRVGLALMIRRLGGLGHCHRLTSRSAEGTLGT